MSRSELAEIVAEQIVHLSQKLNEALTLGKPTEANEYAQALAATADAYNSIEDD